MRILKHKYEVTARKLQVIADKIEQGILVERENVPILRIQSDDRQEEEYEWQEKQKHDYLAV